MLRLCYLSKPGTRLSTALLPYGNDAIYLKHPKFHAKSPALFTRQQRRQQATAAASELVNLNQEDSILQHNAAGYIDEMYMAWKEKPESVHESWRNYFQQLHSEPKRTKPASPAEVLSNQQSKEASATADGRPSVNVSKNLKVQQLIQAYQSLGHQQANLDPLGILQQNDQRGRPIELELHHYGFTEADLDRGFALDAGILPGFATSTTKSMTLREIVSACETTYCGSIGVEYVYIPERQKREWIRNRLETPTPIQYSAEEKKKILDRLVWSWSFEKILATKWPTEKRYGLNGAESLVPGLKALLYRSVEHGAENVVVGSQHRGRLNVLSNVVRMPNELVFRKFADKADPIATQTGDVKYHVGMDNEVAAPSGKKFSISFLPNPSHLEAEDPVAVGKTRAFQERDNGSRDRTWCLNLHGDAALAGQGVVYETLGLSRLRGYTVGGVIYVTVNNQIGFTTDPDDSRSTDYCTDIAKTINAPIFHVNGDDVEAVTFVCQLAADWRAEFHTDCFVDIVCYRKYGHNEMDSPEFTQPFLYDHIRQQPSALDQYINKLLAQGVVTQQEVDANRQYVWDTLNDCFMKSKDYRASSKELRPWLGWDALPSPESLAAETLPPASTAVTEKTIRALAEKLTAVPDGFALHRNIERIIAARRRALDDGEGIDWSTAEALAFGTLLLEGHPVRVSGQDVQRGTFSQRHAVLHPQTPSPDPAAPANAKRQSRNATWTPLARLAEDQARFEIVNSPLGEFGVLGFEYGYTLGDPCALVIWEAQFGDFANNAQVVVDQFVASGETKWCQRSGLVLSLPHRFDGQGPEHSSARMERFLQLCDEDARSYPSKEEERRGEQDGNVQVVCMTTPANLFHVLRRQVRRGFRKPLVIFFSKSLLRHPLARSKIEDFTGDYQFQHIIADPEHGRGIAEHEDIDRVILCSGQVYVALSKYRESHGIRNTAITRIEQLHPFPWSQVKDNLDSYPNAKSIVWCQEEPLNGGAWQHVQPRINTVLKETQSHRVRNVKFVGRDHCASVATGLKSAHAVEEQNLVSGAFGVH